MYDGGRVMIEVGLVLGLFIGLVFTIIVWILEERNK